ncbi:bZIP transcription factor bZIP-1 [Penicillium taxi]|uniref:bZIP transcription factor bZIP-1 n=1 Tax=Penicillium taxi TaxID=168475 RepID=UPI002544D65E|nr:bZIP transcription factor bZIP-1 [Penicillium taxi]KAJ5899116.1 bZIP transcription factor bZIP-1 [Penicillium taxi]
MLAYSYGSSISSPSITISTFDLTSFTTDQFQQPWLPSPPPPQPSASSLNISNNNNNNSALEDFVLYPAPPRPQPRVAPSNIAHRPSALQPFLAQNTPRRHSPSLQLQRHLQQPFSGSPVPDPRVTQLARSPSHWSHPIANYSRSGSLPINTPQRPPNSPFHAGPSDLKKKRMIAFLRNMSATNFQDNDAELFGLPSTGVMESPMAFGQLPLGLDTDSAFSSEIPQGTISPKDLMFDHSVPPSGTFTDLSTPPFDSPATFSQNPSPLFTDVDFMGQDDWAPLFHDGSATPNVFDASFTVAAALADVKKPESEQPFPMSLPRRVSAKASPISATGTTKHSSVSGISRQRKELSPIEFDPTDPIAAKRARNTEAARKSRAKKMERQSTAETRIRELEQQLAKRDEMIANLQAQLEIQKSLQ